MSEISERILALIQKKDLSYSDLSKLTGITKSSLQRYATGSTPKIPMPAIEKLAKALGVTEAYLMGWDKASPKQNDSDKAEQLLEIFRKLSPENQEKILELCRLYIASQQH